MKIANENRQATGNERKEAVATASTPRNESLNQSTSMARRKLPSNPETS